MRIVLRSDIAGLGKRGDLVNVADGYGRNFLLPKGKAIIASNGIVAQADAMRKGRDLRDSKDKESAEAIAGKLVGLTVQLKANAGKEGRLFGSVTVADIVDAVKSQSGLEVDRRKFHLEEPIKNVGLHQVPLKLHNEVEIYLNVEVTPETE